MNKRKIEKTVMALIYLFICALGISLMEYGQNSGIFDIFRDAGALFLIYKSIEGLTKV